jgi:imidazolonepropionase
MVEREMQIFRNIDACVTMLGARKKEGRRIQLEDLSILKKAAIVVDANGKIIWVGLEKNIPKQSFLVPKQAISKQAKKKLIEVDCRGKTLLPGFVDCHTHLIFAGNRHSEFELRNQGISYQEIANQGGGILSTMRATREAKESHLVKLAETRIQAALQQGITTLEVKSGYGLSLESEVKQLKVAQTLRKQNCLRVVSTFLGPHALPPEFKTHAAYLKYITEIVLPILKKKKICKRVDIYIEKGFFLPKEARKYFKVAKNLGFDISVHAEQFSLSGGTDLGIEFGAKSLDHVIQIGKKEIQKIARSQTTAVCLPLADLYLKCQYPQARALIDSGARVAIATDFNPGSSPTQDFQLAGILSRLYMKMTLPEVLSAVTLGGAYALGLENEIGVIDEGYSADFILTEHDWTSLFYSAGRRWISQVYYRGVLR